MLSSFLNTYFTRNNRYKPLYICYKNNQGLSLNVNEIFRGGGEGLSGGMLPLKILKVETKICAIWGILEVNLKKSSTLKLKMNISFVLIFIDLKKKSMLVSFVLIFIDLTKKKSMLLDFFPWKIIFSRFPIFISERILVSATNSRLWNVNGCP